MSLNTREIGQLVGIARAVIEDVDAERTVAANLTFAELLSVAAAGLTRNQIAVLVNRFYNEQPDVGTPRTLAES